MILKLTTDDKAEIWVDLDRIVQMTTISVQDGYPSTEIKETGGYSELDQSQLILAQEGQRRRSCARPIGRQHKARNSRTHQRASLSRTGAIGRGPRFAPSL